MELKESTKNTLKGAQGDTKKPVFTAPQHVPQQTIAPTVIVEKAIVNTPDNSINNISNWSLFPDEAGVRAVNNRSGDVFIGTISDFNNKIR
jgi:hypothetical protein